MKGHICAVVCTIVASTVTATAGPAVIQVPDAHIARFEGTWLGQDNPSPFGPISFAMDFRRETDGSLRSHTPLSRDTWVDLRLRQNENGQWVMDESAALAGIGVQEYTLHPVRAAGDTLEWAYLNSPRYLTVRTAVRTNQLYMLVLLRGEPHVEFHLERVRDAEATTVRAALQNARQRSGEGDLALLQEAGASGASGTAEDPVRVRNARARVLAAPNDARTHLQLASALAEVIESAPPTKVPNYAIEMLGGFRKAVELEPTIAEARFGLAQYYLNAPPIAGGSLDDAAQQANALHELESPLAEVVLAQIAAKRGDTELALQRIREVANQHPDLEIARQVQRQLSAVHDGQTESRPRDAGSEK